MADPAIDFQPAESADDQIDFQPVGEPAINQALATVPRPRVDMQPTALIPQTPDGRKIAAPVPGTELEHFGEMVPQAAVPALAGVEKHVLEPIEKSKQAGGEFFGAMGKEAVTAANFLRDPGRLLTSSDTNAPSAYRETPEEVTARQHPIASTVAERVGENVGSVAGDPTAWPFFLSGTMVAGEARPILQQLTTRGFQFGLGASEVSTLKDLGENWEKYTPAEKAARLTDAGVTAGMLGGAEVIHRGVKAAQEHFATPYEGLPSDPAARTEALFRNLVYKAGGTLPENPTFKQANNAYRAAINNLHPDVNPAHAQEAQTLNDAWSQLKNSGRFNGKASAPAPAPAPAATPQLLPGSVEAELAANPPTRDEIADAQAATNYAGPEEAKAAVVAKRQAQRDAQASAEPPGGPEKAKPAGAVETRTPTPAGTPEEQAIDFKPAETVEPTQEPERRQDIAERKRVEHMTPEEMRSELLTSKQTGLPNRRAFDEAEKPPAAAMSDADGLKAFNDKFGYEAGNALLQAKADALRQAGLDAYHDKGDEFLYRGASADELSDKLEKAREILRNKQLRVTKQDGSQYILKGVDFSYGTGKDLAEAESGLKAHKSEREARGERARGELRGITEVAQGLDQKGRAGEVGQPLYKHRSTQINIPAESEAHTALAAARQRIAPADLMPEAGANFGDKTASSGMETEPHVTVRWGLTAPDEDKLEKLKSYLSSLSPFDATLGKTEKFPPSESSDGAAVIHAPIEAPELHQINQELEQHAPFTEPSFKEYRPHATIAYVKPEKADRYVGMDVTNGKKFRVNSIAITHRNGKQEEVKLEGKPPEPAEQAEESPIDFQASEPTIEQGHEPQNQPARAPEQAENLPGVSEPAREGGGPSTPVPSEGNGGAPQEGETGRSARPANGERLEQPARQPGERNAPERSGGSSAAANPAAERGRRGARSPRPTGADGKPVESPTPEEPEQAVETTAAFRNLRNFRISDEYAAKIGSGGEITKIKGNLDALETLKKIQSEGRELATPEEQEVLSRYVDFGGLVGMLQRWWEPQYKGHYERFQKLLTSAEQQEIRETLPNTHYTSMQMVDWMWKAMQRMGLKGGRILEPGMGIGNFLGRIPEKISNRAELLGVERNPLTGGMARLLYPDAKIAVKPFQDFLVPNNSLDAVIGNVPFQDVTILDDPAYAKLRLNLHNYFIVKSLDKLKPGGIAALITSRYTMDSGKGQRAREEMAKRADLVAAMRLPDAAFKRNAGTEVVADLLVFQKRAPEDVIEKMPEWTTLAPLKVKDKEYLVSKYFIDNPNNVLGEHSAEGSMYGPGQYTVKGPADFAQALEGATDLIPAKIFGKLKPSEAFTEPATLDAGELQFAPEDVKPGAFYKDPKGNLRVKEAGVGVELPPELRSIEKQEHIRRAIDLRDQLNRTLQTQLETSDDGPLKEEQAKLGKLYDGYRKKYGPVHGPKLKQLFGSDPEYPKLLALENLDTETKEVSKAAIFSKRVLAPYEPLRELPEEPKAAMLKVMAERGYLDTALMADLLKKPEAEVISGLEEKNLVFQDPQTGNYHTADEYLSGNVREKLKLAEKAADTDRKFSRNVEELKKVQPERLSIHDIQSNLGQTWIPVSIYEAFVKHLAQSPHGEVTISRDMSGKWLVQAGNINRFHLQHEWAGGGVEGHKLVQAALNQTQPTVWIKHSDGSRTIDGDATTAAREKLAVIKEEFRTVLRKAPQGVVDRLENIYNDTFNGFRLREFNGEHLDFPGMSEEWRGKIRGYQKAAVWRILQEGRAGIFHAPGLGKTLTMTAAGMEARRLKLSRKNMYAVPNHMVNQWREDFKRFYPNANVLAVSDEDFNAQNRAKLMSRIATGDWDAVIVPHSQFDLLPMSPEWEAKTINKRLDDYRQVLEDLDDKEDRRTIKQIEKAIDKLESRLHELNAKKKDNTIAFDQMGVDMLFVDEAHAYKAMAVPSRMGNIGGLSNRASQRAFALEMKGDFLRDTHKGRGLVFGTGTPITNTVGELYVMTKYLAPDMLESAGLRSFDDWAANFATTITQWEYAPDGVNFRPKTTLSEFVNVPELSTMFRRYAEYLSKEAAKQLSNLKEPEAVRKDRMLKITPTQEPLLQMIAERGERLTKHPPRTTEERKEDNWLKLSSDARKISLDPRLYDSALHDDPGSKVNSAVDDIKGVLDATKDKLGTVVVFSDFFQHKDELGKPDFNLFEDIREKLIKKGVPRDQIAIIHEAATKDEKEALFARVRAGKVRVICGSTDKMGIGTNIQDRLKMELHLDQPWRPDQVEQREGRIIRSGNMWDDVQINRYIAEPEEGTVKRWDPDQQREVEKPRPRAYDLQMYQQLARKAHFQEQFLTGNFKGRTMEDVGGDVKLNSQMFELAKAMATGNPDTLRKIKVEHDLRTFGMLERNFQVQRSKQSREEANLEYRIPIIKSHIGLLERDVELWAKAGEKPAVTIGEVTRQGDSLKEWLDTEPNIQDLVDKKLSIGGVETRLEQKFTKDLNKRTGVWEDGVRYLYSLAGEEHEVPFDHEKQVYHVRAFINSFASRARSLVAQLETARFDLRHYQDNLASLREELKKTSPYAEKLAKLESEIKEIDKRLGVSGSGEVDEAAAPDESEEEPRTVGGLLRDESGAFIPGRLRPSYIRAQYNKAVEEFISGKLEIGDKYHEVAKYDPVVADTLHLVDNAPRYFRAKAAANLKAVLDGLSDDQVRLASLMADSDSRDYLLEHKPDELQKALDDPQVMEAVRKFKPLQDEMASDRIALGWPVRRNFSVQENEDAGAGDDRWQVVDRDGSVVQEFKSKAKAQRFVEQNGTIEPHLKRTYPEHLRNPLPMETGKAPFTGSFYADKGLRPPNIDKKSRVKSAEYHYEHGAKDFSGYVESFVKTKEAVLKQNLFDRFSNEATKWIAGTAQPPEIEYNGKTYYRPDIALQMRRSREKNVPEYSVYDPSKGERFLVRAMPTEESQGWAQLSTGKPEIGPYDRFLGPKAVVDALERYDAHRAGEPSSLRRFFQEQIVGLFGPMVHINNILRRVGQTTGVGTFDPRSWPAIAKVILSPELRARVMRGVDDDTIDLLMQRGAYTDWRDIGSLNAYVGGNLNPFNWVRWFGKAVLFDPKFLGGWGGLDPKARIVVADYLKEHYPDLSEQQIADAVNDGLGNYNRANWTERQRMLAKFCLFPGWDAASFKWFLRHPFVTAVAPALVILAINMALRAMGKNKGDDDYDLSYVHWGDRKFRSGLVSDSMAEHAAGALRGAAEAALKREDVAAGATEGALRGFSNMAGTLAGPTVQMVANQIFNRKFAGGESEIVQPQDKYTPGTWAPNRELEKRISYTFLKGLPALNRFMSSEGKFDWMQGLGSIAGITNYRYGAEERLRANVARSMDLSKTLSSLSERDPEAANRFVQNPTTAAYLAFHGDLDQMAKDLKSMDQDREALSLAAGLTDAERRNALQNLADARKKLLTSADTLNELLVEMKLQKPAPVSAAAR